MNSLTTHIQLPLTFNESRLLEDLKKLQDFKWVPHYNTYGYTGSWTSAALVSSGGKADAIYALPDEKAPLLETEILEACPYFKEVLQNLQFPLASARLLCLAPGAAIKPHRDHCLGYEDGVFRIHIPIQTNTEVEFILNKERINMKPGECWYIDANFEHSVANRGTEERIHLVIDGERNAWTDRLFFSVAAEDSFKIHETKTLPPEQQERMVKELERMNSPVAKQLLEGLKKTV